MRTISTCDGPVPIAQTVFTERTVDEQWASMSAPDDSLLFRPWDMSSYVKYRVSESALAEWLYDNGYRCIPRFVTGPEQFVSEGGSLPDIPDTAKKVLVHLVEEGGRFVRVPEEDVRELIARAKLTLMFSDRRIYGKLKYTYVRARLRAMSVPCVSPPDVPNSYHAWMRHRFGTDDASVARMKMERRTPGELYDGYRSYLLDILSYFRPADMDTFYKFLREDMGLSCRKGLSYSRATAMELADRPLFRNEDLELVKDALEKELGDRERAELRMSVMSDDVFIGLVSRIRGEGNEEGGNRSDGTEVREAPRDREGSQPREEGAVEMHMRLRERIPCTDVQSPLREPAFLRMLSQGALPRTGIADEPQRF